MVPTGLEKSWNLTLDLKSHGILCWPGKMAFCVEKSLKISGSHWKISCALLNFIWTWKHWWLYDNKANLRDLIAATGLVILLKLDSNCRFFARVTLKFDGWPWKIIRHVSYTTSSFNLCIISDPSGNSNWRYSPETANLGQNRRFF